MSCPEAVDSAVTGRSGCELGPPSRYLPITQRQRCASYRAFEHARSFSRNIYHLKSPCCPSFSISVKPLFVSSHCVCGSPLVPSLTCVCLKGASHLDSLPRINTFTLIPLLSLPAPREIVVVMSPHASSCRLCRDSLCRCEALPASNCRCVNILMGRN